MFVCGTKKEKLVCRITKKEGRVSVEPPSPRPFTKEECWRLNYLKRDIYQILFSLFIKEDAVIEFRCPDEKKHKEAMITFLRDLKVKNLETSCDKKMNWSYIKGGFLKEIAIMFLYALVCDYGMPLIFGFVVRKNKSKGFVFKKIQDSMEENMPGDVIYISRDGRPCCDSFILKDKNSEETFINVLKEFAKEKLLKFEVER